MILVIICLAEKSVMPLEEYQDRTLAISMLTGEVHYTIVDVESDKGNRNRTCSDC